VFASPFVCYLDAYSSSCRSSQTWYGIDIANALNSVYHLSIDMKVSEQNVQQLNSEIREITEQYQKMVKPVEHDEDGAMFR
jgi:hypothetical protein